MQDIAGVSIGTAVSAAAAAAASSSVSRVGCLPASCFWDFFIGASADFSRCLPNCVVAIGPQHVTITSFTSFGAWAKFWLTLVPTAKRCGFGAIPRVTHNAVDIIIFSRTVLNGTMAYGGVWSCDGVYGGVGMWCDVVYGVWWCAARMTRSIEGAGGVRCMLVQSVCCASGWCMVELWRWCVGVRGL